MASCPKKIRVNFTKYNLREAERACLSWCGSSSSPAGGKPALVMRGMRLGGGGSMVSVKQEVDSLTTNTTTTPTTSPASGMVSGFVDSTTFPSRQQVTTVTEEEDIHPSKIISTNKIGIFFCSFFLLIGQYRGFVL